MTTRTTTERATTPKVGRPTKCTPQLTKQIAEGIRAGLYAETVCEAAGIDPATYRRWLADRPEFRAVIKKAEAEQQGEALARIRAGGDGWQSGAWHLERRYPKQWGLRVKTAVMDQEDELLRRLRDGLDEATYLRVLGVLSGDEDKGAEPSMPMSADLLASMAKAYGMTLVPQH